MDMGEAAPPLGRRQDLRRVLRELLKNKAALLGVAILGMVTACAILAPVISPADPLIQEVSVRLKPPTFEGGDGRAHLLGTDQAALHLVVVDGREVAARGHAHRPAGLLEQVDGSVLQAPLGDAELQNVGHDISFGGRDFWPIAALAGGVPCATWRCHASASPLGRLDLGAKSAPGW